jgi:hypothetical protein
LVEFDPSLSDASKIVGVKLAILPDNGFFHPQNSQFDRTKLCEGTDKVKARNSYELCDAVSEHRRAVTFVSSLELL